MVIVAVYCRDSAFVMIDFILTVYPKRQQPNGWICRLFPQLLKILPNVPM
jgi:hypothetical protein